MKRLRAHTSFANLMSILALFLALAGGAYAAVRAGSIGTRQLKKNAVVSTKVKNGSLLRKDIGTTQVPIGARGPRGATGLAGPTGATGPVGSPGPATTSAFAESDADVVLPSAPTDNLGGVQILTAPITTQSSQRFFVTGSADLIGGEGDIGKCGLSISGSGTSSFRTDFDDRNPPNHAVVTVSFAIVLGPGTYTASMGCGSQAGSVTKVAAGLNVFATGPGP